MKMRKMLLLVGTLVAMTAVGATAAQAKVPEWYIHGKGGDEKLTGNEELIVKGEVTSEANGVESGPCNFELIGTATNVNGMAGGIIIGGTPTAATCPTNIPGCTFVPTVLASETEEGWWSLTGATVGAEPGLEVIGMAITSHYNAVCQGVGIPATVVTIGTATPILENSSCLTFEESVDDMLSGGMWATEIYGEEICFGGNLTLK